MPARDPSQASRGDGLARSRRYAAAGRFYDLLSGERPVYRAGREVGVWELRLRPGSHVLDLGCGTGLSFPLLRGAVGARGRVVGVDLSREMLERARGRVSRAGWDNVECMPGDAGDLGGLWGEGPGAFDAVLLAYSLSVMSEWEVAFDQAWRSLVPGGRIAVVDMALPVGRWRILAPLASIACAAGGADPHRAPWRLVEQRAADVSRHVLRGGHIRVAAGTSP